MKKTISTMIMTTLVLGMMTTASYAAELDNNEVENPVGASGAIVDENYTLEDMLQYALEDERLAMAEYEAIIAEFEVDRPFSNILKAEYTHEAAVISLDEAKGIEGPEFDATAYVVIPDTMEEIYSIGVEAEIKNIEMYESFLLEDLDDDVRSVFEALKSASESHLKAFERGVSGGAANSSSSTSGNSADNKGNSASNKGNSQSSNGNRGKGKR